LINLFLVIFHLIYIVVYSEVRLHKGRLLGEQTLLPNAPKLRSAYMSDLNG